MILSAAPHLTLYDLEEGLSERLVEERVEERVDHGGGVAQPGHEVDHLALNVRPAGDKDVGDEERGPQKNEREEHNPQHLQKRGVVIKNKCLNKREQDLSTCKMNKNC